MKKKVTGLLAVLALATAAPASAQDADMSFFITSRGSGDGANLGGLEGADQHCQDLAYAVGFGDRTWRAYLSAAARGGQPAVHARDRIGSGPWYNHAGDLVARNPDELHTDAANLTKESILTEQGSMVNGRGDDPNMHDILTGSDLDGTLFQGEGHTVCDNWTSNGSEGGTRVGHHDRQGGGDNPTSWNSAHTSRGCSQENLQATGGNGYFYCFAADGGEDEQARREERR